MRRWGAALEALLCLLYWQFLVKTLAFRSIAAHLDKPPRREKAETDRDTRPAAVLVRWAIAAVSRRLPWRVNCLPQALAAAAMLHRRGVANTLYIGAQRSPERSFRGHAWVMAGDICVTGGRDSSDLPVFARYPR